MQVVRGVFYNYAIFLVSRDDQHPIAAFALYIEHVRITEVVVGVGAAGGKGILGDLGPVQQIITGRVHDGFLRSVEIVVTGIKGVVKTVLSLDHAACSERDVLLLGGFRIWDHDAEVLIITVVFRPHQRPGVIAGLAVPLVCKVKDIHLSVVIERHRIAYKSELKSREQSLVVLFLRFAGLIFRLDCPYQRGCFFRRLLLRLYAGGRQHKDCGRCYP